MPFCNFPPRFATHFCAAMLTLVVVSSRVNADPPSSRAPNLVIIFCDDLGYGDVGCYGHPTLLTPHIDRMAAEGLRCTQFYAAGNCCTPSRAGLLTGRLPIRNGMCGRRRVLMEDSVGGIQEEEFTLAELLKQAGYTTGCVGKWHLGHLPPYLPTRHGFDEYFGIPYSNDMNDHHPPLMRGEAIIAEQADQSTITRQYTEEALAFIDRNKEEPFFLYFPHTFPHRPLSTNERFEGTSARGLFGDVVEEIDWSVGQILEALRQHGIAEETLVLFTSDNGPGKNHQTINGSAGPLRGFKGSSWDGGMREPAIFWWPGTIAPTRVSLQISSTMDLFSTFAALTEQALPEDRIYDSHDLMPMLTDSGPTTREAVLFYRARRLQAVRLGPYKAHYYLDNGHRQDPPLLYHLEEDPGERWDIASEHPEVLAELEAFRQQHLENLVAPPSQVDRGRR